MNGVVRGVLAGLLSAGLAFGALSAPAAAFATAAEVATSSVDLTGEIVELADAPKQTDDTKLFHVSELGYLPIDFSAVELGALSVGTITVRLTVDPGVDLGDSALSQFDALTALVASGAVLLATDIVPPDRRTAAMINQTPAATGVHQIYAMPVTPANVSGTGPDTNQARSNIQADVNHTNSYWLSQSDGQVGFELAGAGAWYRSAYSCSTSSSSNFYNLIAEAKSRAASQLGYQDAPNNHLVLIFPANAGCGGSIGIGTIGMNVTSGGALWVIGTASLSAKQTLSHELGHNLSLGHASWLNCSSANPDPGLAGTNGCTRNEYGDITDVMGYGISGSTGGSLSSPGAIRASLWKSTSYAEAPEGTNSFVLNPLSSSTGLRSVMVEDSNGTSYFVEFRDKTGIDGQYQSLNPPCPTNYCTATTPGVRILRLEQQQYSGRYYKGVWSDASELFGRTVSGVRKTTYVVGESFTLNGVVVSVTALSATTATVSVTRPATVASTGLLDIWCTACSTAPGYNVGDTLTGMLDSGWRAESYAFQWYRNTSTATSPTAISGATGQSYTLTTADLGKYIKVRVIATTDGSPSGNVASPADSSPSPGIGPIQANSIVAGTISVQATGLSLSATPSDWYPSGLTYSYQWRRSGVAIAGATGATYNAVSQDTGAVLSVKVTASKSGFTTVSALSAGKNYTLSATGTLAISGTSQVGKPLTVSDLSYSSIDGPVSSPTRSYQWKRAGVAIAGATSSSYTLAAADFGQPITVTVTGTSSGYLPHIATSPASAAVIRGDIAGSLAPPVVTKTPGTVDLTVALPIESITDDVILTYQWYRNDVAIAGGNAATYTLTSSDHGSAIKARIVATKSNYNSVALYSTAALYSVLADGAIGVSGTAQIGKTLTATTPNYSIPSGAVSPSFAYQWLRNGTVIAGATAAQYTPSAADYTTKLQVRVTASATGYISSVLTSPATAAVTKGVFTGSGAVPVVSNDPVTMTLTAALPDGSVDGSGHSIAYQWYRAGVAIPLATGALFHLTAADYNKAISVRFVVTKLNYESLTLFSVPVNYSLMPSTPLPVIVGPLAPGETLQLADRTFTAADSAVAPVLTYSWLRDGVAVGSGDTYVLQSADVGKSIAVRVDASYSGFLPSVSTSAATQKIGSSYLAGWDQPVTVSKVDATKVLTAVPGVTETGTTFARQWYRNGVAIYLATGASYTLTAADFGKLVSVRVIASKPGFTTVVAFSSQQNYSVTAAAPVAVSGVAKVGVTLTASPPSYSTAAGPATPVLAYQWLHNGAVIVGATASTYTPVASDYGTKLQVRVTAPVTGFLTSTLTSAATAAVAKGSLAGTMALPTVTVNPTTMKLTAALTDGSVSDGGIVTSFQWYRNGVAVPYSTLASYQLTAADYSKTVHVRLVVSKPNYNSVVLVSALENYSVVPSAALPTFTGTVAQGQTLTMSALSFTADGGAVTPTVTQVWLRDGVAVGTADSYLLQPADVGKTISLRVTATYPGFLPFAATSAGTQKVGVNALLNADAPVTVSQSGMVLTAVPGVTEPGATFAKQWYRNGAAVSLASGTTYALSAADYGKSISVRVTASKATYTTVVAFSTPVNYSVAASGALGMTGTVRVGMPLSATALSYSSSAGPASPTLTYQWLRNGGSIPGANASSYTVGAGDYGSRLQVRVTASVAGLLSNTTTSPLSAIVAKGVLTGTMAAPTVTKSATPARLSVALTDGSIEQTGLVLSYQWYRNGVAISLATASSYNLSAADYGKDLTVRVIVAKSNYTSVVQVSGPTVP